MEGKTVWFSWLQSAFLSGGQKDNLRDEEPPLKIFSSNWGWFLSLNLTLALFLDVSLSLAPILWITPLLIFISLFIKWSQLCGEEHPDAKLGENGAWLMQRKHID